MLSASSIASIASANRLASRVRSGRFAKKLSASGSNETGHWRRSSCEAAIRRARRAVATRASKRRYGIGNDWQRIRFLSEAVERRRRFVTGYSNGRMAGTPSLCGGRNCESVGTSGGIGDSPAWAVDCGLSSSSSGNRSFALIEGSFVSRRAAVTKRRMDLAVGCSSPKRTRCTCCLL
ncbi:MAG: hypothetical protein QOC81_3625 [Thermoanaerobaculia bacterium]|nr:hypothetical protein [Thermoanaerobaculia bacterium]